MPEQRLEDAWLPLRETRAELLGAIGEVLPESGLHRAEGEERMQEQFPRSRLFRSLVGHKHRLWMIGAVVALAAANPRLAAQLARRVPVRYLATQLLPLLR